MNEMQNRRSLNEPDLHSFANLDNTVERGRLYVFEGPDDVGKTTLATMLSDYFSSNGLKNQLLSFPGREPHTISELIYRLYHAPDVLGVESILPVTMQVMVTAAHIEVIEARIKPLLRAGVNIILDRFWWSTWVYATQEKVPLKTRDLLIAIEMESWKAIEPDVIFLIMRHEPLLTQADDQRWHEVSQLYKELSAARNEGAPIQIVMNDRSESEAFSTIVSRISQCKQ